MPDTQLHSTNSMCNLNGTGTTSLLTPFGANADRSGAGGGPGAAGGKGERCMKQKKACLASVFNSLGGKMGTKAID